MKKSTPVWSATQLRNARYFQRFHHAQPHKMNRDKITDKHLAAAASIQPDYWFYMPDEEDWPKKWEEDDGSCLKRILGNYSWKKVVSHFETTEILAHIKSAEDVPGGEQASQVNELPADSEQSGPASEEVEAADRDNQNTTVTGSPDTTNASGDDDGRASRIHGGRSDIEYPTIRTGNCCRLPNDICLLSKHD
ncbi:hypothetical protein K4K54_003824 [Colletotrichum sp. SAR 10_86]|nr:hypothetical protein K4K54_003824 [Colletotrichum sp. SAR 10_86]KAJ5002012.1 hypothetical protein K4K48_000690 [Colletotrichum sp. SAR 10_66]